MLEPGNREVHRFKIIGVRQESYQRTSVALDALADGLEGRLDFAVGELHLINLPIPPDNHLKAAGQGVHHRHAHPVQAAAELVVLVGELAARMQGAENHFHPRPFQFRVFVHRHTAAVIANREGTALVQGHRHFAGETGESLVHTVVDDFLGQVVGPRSVGVHPRALAYWL